MNIQYAVLNKDKANELVHADIRGTDLSKVIVAFDDKNNGHLVTNK